MADNAIDVPQLPAPDEHRTIFAGYDDPPVGGSFVLVNDQEPEHLREGFEADHAGTYRWEYIENGPTVRRIQISKLATSPLPRVLTNTADIAANRRGVVPLRPTVRQR